MKKFIITIMLSAAAVLCAGAQDSLRISVATPEGLTHENAVSTLTSNLRQALILNNVSAEDSRFVLRTEVTELSKGVTSTAPPMFVTELEISMFVTDTVTGENLSQTSFTLKGIADNNQTSYMDAVKKIRARDSKLRALIMQAGEYFEKHINQ
ncbi:MAG TPA: hypothetical protein IAC03_02505 [Candidatus Coprenecus pullistercoris]|nr:hypothetical protein [Candidatus Coprenecus pullistercoris]